MPMTEFNSPVPFPAADAAAPEPYREFYGMPMFVTVTTGDMERSKEFWLRGLGFIDLFSIPGQVTHLRRRAFQDVLLVPGEKSGSGAGGGSGVSTSFACVLGQIDEIAERCERLVPGCTQGPEEKPWNSIELTVVTPEGARVVMTAAEPLEPRSAKADELRAPGFRIPGD